MSQIVDCKGVVPLKEIEGIAIFYTRSFIGGVPYYLCQVVRGNGEVLEQMTDEGLDSLISRENRGYHAELAALWREFRRNYEGPQWAKRERPVAAPVKLARVSSVADKRSGKIIH